MLVWYVLVGVGLVVNGCVYVLVDLFWCGVVDGVVVLKSLVYMRLIFKRFMKRVLR